ncbi:MAG: NAD(P)/FAD-dependent oxidoreductase [Pseudomonadota bacterium]
MKTLIVGGGLSGLALAERLEAQGQDYHLLEARDRFGGRIMTERLGDGYFDMGPAWFWPGQPRIETLIARLGLKKFGQFSSGELTYEDEMGRVQRGLGFASMQGSWRLEGGLATLTEALQQRLPALRKQLNAQVKGLAQSAGGIRAILADGRAIDADRAVLAVPPRIAANLAYSPELPDTAVQAMANISTWMAGQAKAVAVYDQAFWRDAGISGDAMSRRGPMVEIHDASPAEGGPFALFGFIGVPPHARSDLRALRQAIEAQLVRLFGEGAAAPRALYLKDWAFDPLTATPADAVPQHSHPAYGLPVALENLWDGRLMLAGTEVAESYGGYIEGALEAAETAMNRLEAKQHAYR